MSGNGLVLGGTARRGTQTVSERADHAAGLAQAAYDNEALTRGRVEALEARIAALEAKLEPPDDAE